MSEMIQNGHLFWDGCDTVDLAQAYGTPLYVFSKTAIVARCQELQTNFIDKYERVRVAYASKAFNTLAMLKLVEQEGLCLDVVTGGELYTAIQADFPAEKIEFNGNNKSLDELVMALDYGVGRIIVDGVEEIERIEAVCRQNNQTTKVLFRITPEVTAQTHQYISTGQKDSKFGLPLEDSILYPMIKKALDSPYLDFYGLHFHVGSQLSDNGAHLAATKTALTIIAEVKRRFDHEVKELNVGGGFGVRYTKEDVRQPYAYFLDPLMAEIAQFCQEKDLRRPTIVIEPGRSIVAEAGLSLHTIGSIKEVPGMRTYAAIDGGMTDNIRPRLYQAQYSGMIANRAKEAVTQTVTIAGKACESTDILIKDLAVPQIEPGDLFATFTTGAYGYSMASNYNKIPIPAAVLVDQGKAELIVARQSYAQLIQNERVPESLGGN